MVLCAGGVYDGVYYAVAMCMGGDNKIELDNRVGEVRRPVHPWYAEPHVCRCRPCKQPRQVLRIALLFFALLVNATYTGPDISLTLTYLTLNSLTLTYLTLTYLTLTFRY